MGEGADFSERRADKSSPSKTGSGEDGTARQILMEESRTAASQQLGQLNKIDDEAVRTVKIAVLLAGILAGGSQFPHFPNLGLFGAFGMWSLVSSLFGGLYVYGTSRLFVGSNPAELDIDYEKSPTIGDTRVEVIRRYETGISHNWSALYANGFVLAVSRLLLALAVLFILLGIVRVT
jgi:hypothetical protein